MAGQNISNRAIQADPAIEYTEVELDGNKYRMCMDYDSLAEAEEHFQAAGKNISLLMALPNMNLKNIRIVFAAAIHRYHPELSFEEAMRIVTLPNSLTIAYKISEAWRKALPDAEPRPLVAGGQ
jgi:hypothetical protein